MVKSVSSKGVENPERAMYRACVDEYLSHRVYKVLAKSPLIGGGLKTALEKGAEDEWRHYVFWRQIVGDCTSKALFLKVFFYVAVFYLFGLTVTLKILESKETSAASFYKYLATVRPDLSNEVSRIVEDEEKHEKVFAESVDERRVKYIGSITLGISDALVELTGIYTGSLGAFENTLSAGLTGLLAGLAASISMGVASYAQAKHEGRLNPKLSAIYTSTAYVVVVLLLALPYFTLSSLLHAFIAMLVIAMAVVAYITLYASVLHGKKYLREFTETALLIFGVSLLLYVVGSALGGLMGVKHVD